MDEENPQDTVGHGGVMLTSLSIENFRLFKKLEVKSLNRVNLIAGENNVGKTALLEALYLLFADSNRFMDFPSILRTSQGVDEFDSFWLWLFYDKNQANRVEIKASGDHSYAAIVDQQADEFPGSTATFQYLRDGVLTGQRRVNRDGSFGRSDPTSGWPGVTVFSTSPSAPADDADHFNLIAAKRGGRRALVEQLRIVEPRLQDLQYLKIGKVPLVYADVGMENLVPCTQLGQGFSRLLRLFSEMLLAKSKIALIDEIENGIHYSAMGKVWKGIAAVAAKEDLRVFATTHSYECIRSAHKSFSAERQYDLTVHRLERVGEDIRVASYDRTSLETSFEMNLEVR